METNTEYTKILERVHDTKMLETNKQHLNTENWYRAHKSGKLHNCPNAGNIYRTNKKYWRKKTNKTKDSASFVHCIVDLTTTLRIQRAIFGSWGLLED